ncbi:DUF397 domain-containing protein [Streptomyces durbertensis]|uniref:DUF397 domain-containing protein n=1 Tax=Streptomyces durbertensis TaxID=2448886 RepID=A0ABR6EET0_9ACTN|nr:DUF397 domain-containing protein [Streptomyces durbertensis]MBB1243820.1 DUF397 domain-containing protein [Streptomyces durbertensis]
MDQLSFRKSSFSSGSGECVEVATNVAGAVAVQDSKRPDARFVTTPDAWADFLADLGKRPVT